jgi:phosphoribosyl-ATP pyrophosphohydrolase/phosphoribosyl-AMP cyclohydrolase
MELVDAIDFDTDTGLVPAVVQSEDDGRVLMLAYMDRRALRLTLERGRVTFWSRSREELWEKGATSGNWLEAVEVRADCDRDALLVRARPHGPACHTGEPSCFDAGPSRAVPGEPGGPEGRGDDPPEPSPPGPGAAAESPAAAPGGAPGRGEGTAPDLSDAARSPAPVLASVLEELVEVVARRDRERPEGSHTASLLEGGTSPAARKVGEEALEVALAAVDEPGRLAQESADLLYHLVVLWRAAGLPADAVGRELADRRGGPAGRASSSGGGAPPEEAPDAGEGP